MVIEHHSKKKGKTFNLRSTMSRCWLANVANGFVSRLKFTQWIKLYGIEWFKSPIMAVVVESCSSRPRTGCIWARFARCYGGSYDGTFVASYFLKSYTSGNSNIFVDCCWSQMKSQKFLLFFVIYHVIYQCCWRENVVTDLRWVR